MTLNQVVNYSETMFISGMVCEDIFVSSFGFKLINFFKVLIVNKKLKNIILFLKKVSDYLKEDRDA